MLGPVASHLPDQPVVVSLDALVPQDHFYRHLDARLDLAFVRDWSAAPIPTAAGRPSILLFSSSSPW
jgi:hypothetical protein